MILVALLTASCSHRAGSGNVLTEIRKVDDFNGIVMNGDMSLSIAQSNKFEVKVTADDNILNLVQVAVKNGVLFVECRRQPEISDITVSVSMPDLKTLETQGRVIVSVKEGFAVKDLEIRLNGSGNMDCPEIKSDGAIKILNRGSNNINISGSAKMFSCVTRDAGNIFADKLEAGAVVAKVAGSGSAFVKTDGNLSVIVAGSGSVVYSGKPSMISKYVTGTGTLSQRK